MLALYSMASTNPAGGVFRSIIGRLRRFHVLLIVPAFLFLANCSVVKAPITSSKGDKRRLLCRQGSLRAHCGTTKIVYTIESTPSRLRKRRWIGPSPTKISRTSTTCLPARPSARAGQNSSVHVKGKRYYPMSAEQAKSYDETEWPPGTATKPCATIPRA
jgi:hypothetical protein